MFQVEPLGAFALACQNGLDGRFTIPVQGHAVGEQGLGFCVYLFVWRRPLGALRVDKAEMVIVVGKPSTRKVLAVATTQTGFRFATPVNPTAVLRPS